jgi:hypothetical protein
MSGFLATTTAGGVAIFAERAVIALVLGALIGRSSGNGASGWPGCGPTRSWPSEPRCSSCSPSR